MNDKVISHRISEAEAICCEKGVRLTDQRKTVLRLLCEASRPLSAYELLERLRGILEHPAPPTVYRALEFLIEQGLVHKLESLHAYVRCTCPGHRHTNQFLICADCGGVDELDDPQLGESLQAASAAAGFRTSRPIVELVGTCARCGAKAPA